MYAGRLVETGPCREVIGAPLHPYTRGLAGAFPTVGDPRSRRAPGGLAGDPPNLRETIGGCSFAPRCAQVEERCLSGSIPMITRHDRAAACIHVDGEERALADA